MKDWALFRCTCGRKFTSTCDSEGRCPYCMQTIFVGGFTSGMRYLKDLSEVGDCLLIVEEME